MFRTPLTGLSTAAAALFAQPAGRLVFGRLRTGAIATFRRSPGGACGIGSSRRAAPRVLQTRPAKLYSPTEHRHYLDVARVLLHDTRLMFAPPVGHRFWLRWLSANRLTEIAGLKESYPVLLQKLSIKPAAATNTGGK
jgi:hypothetical protein